MITKLHFQFGYLKPETIEIEFDDARYGRYFYLSTYQRRKVREIYKKVFHRKMPNEVDFFARESKPGPKVDLNKVTYSKRNTYWCRGTCRILKVNHLWTDGRYHPKYAF